MHKSAKSFTIPLIVFTAIFSLFFASVSYSWMHLHQWLMYFICLFRCSIFEMIICIRQLKSSESINTLQISFESCSLCKCMRTFSEKSIESISTDWSNFYCIYLLAFRKYNKRQWFYNFISFDRRFDIEMLNGM